jgi:stage II sporulation protein AA (anti-sigma F factor antagonist)
MSSTVEINGNVARIVLAGALDFSTQEEIHTAHNQALTASGVQEIQVDFRDVTFVDSSVIRALLQIRKKAAAQGKSLILTNCHAPIMEIFIVGGFDRVFTIRS